MTAAHPPRRYFWMLCLGLGLALGIFLHLRNLYGVVYIDEDEARAFNLLSSGPLIYLICAPVYNLFHHLQRSVFFFAGLFGVASILLVYAAGCQLGIGRSRAAFAALIYAIYPLRINYARTLYPAVFIEFFFLVAFLAAARGLSKKNHGLIFLSGISCACIFFTHYCGYAIIAGLSFFIVASSLEKGDRFSLVARRVAFFAGGFCAGYLALDATLAVAGHGYEYTRQMLTCRTTELHYAQWVREVPFFLRDLGKGVTGSWQWVFISLIVTGAVSYGIVTAWFGKERSLRWFFLIFIVGGALFIGLAYAGCHSIKERHFVWFSSFFSIAATGAVAALFTRTSRGGKAVLGCCAAVFIGVLFFESYQITVETFKITEMRSWLERNHISRQEVITSWWTINFLGDTEVTSLVPGHFVTEGAIRDPSLWYRNDPRFKIDWASVGKAYEIGVCRYLLTSGTSARFTLGEGEELLQRVHPLMVWPHPYCAFRRRPFYVPGKIFIKLYDLRDVFSSENLKNFHQGVS
ncbi:MAG: glycosyltransferase family 39 protein [Candidatus Omnitrophota bacterium]